MHDVRHLFNFYFILVINFCVNIVVPSKSPYIFFNSHFWNSSNFINCYDFNYLEVLKLCIGLTGTIYQGLFSQLLHIYQSIKICASQFQPYHIFVTACKTTTINMQFWRSILWSTVCMVRLT